MCYVDLYEYRKSRGNDQISVLNVKYLFASAYPILVACAKSNMGNKENVELSCSVNGHAVSAA
jgi:hypothetical protein